MTPCSILAQRLHSLVIFRNFLKLSASVNLLELLSSSHENNSRDLDLYAEFCCELFSTTENWSRWLLDFVLKDENIYTKLAIDPRFSPSSELEKCLTKELKLLELLSQLSSAEIRREMKITEPLPQWTTESIDFVTQYRQRIAEIPQKGFGIFAQYHVFVLDQDGALIPVRHPDPQKLSHLYGYERERSKIIQNTKALLEGRPANNVLLYGDAGTGKSSTVKAIANTYCSQGLRLVEVKKTQLYLIPALLDSLANNPLKFILFIDDLCFNPNDNDFSALKAILEGSVTGRGHNTLIYATSNHRHMVKETFSERQGDDVHISDTLQEIISLSARFGLTVTFSRPEKEQYCEIVLRLADQYSINEDPAELLRRAEADAIRSGGRNPRVAKQFIEGVKAGVH